MENEMKHTCLWERHEALNAKMAPFAGYDMPIEYNSLDAEHTAVRTCSGLFDVSHMGEIYVTGADAVAFVDHIFTNYVAPMHIGQVLYGMMTYPDGGTVDDLLVYRLGDESFLLVVNASNLEKDVNWVRDCAEGYRVKIRDYSAECGQIALQGPDSEKILKTVLGIDASALTFYTFTVLDGNIIVSRTGYTGEDGFEIYADPSRIVEMWNSLIAYGIQPCGLGCRDTLRFEAGLPLYGDELSETITPIEAGLGIFVKLDKPGGFIGSDELAKQKAEGPRRKLIGLEIDSKAAARHGFEVLDMDGAVVGHITTGYNSLTLGKNIALALVEARYAPVGSRLQVRIRRKLAPATVIKKRFYVPNYKK